jgi:hypothetical protein
MMRHSQCPIYGLPLSPGGASAAPAEAKGSCARLSGLRSVFRAASILPVILAIAVVLWGLAYKLSLYHVPPNHSGRTNVAKLWTGTQEDPFRIKSPRRNGWPTDRPLIRAFATDSPSHSDVQTLLSLVRVGNRSHSRLDVLRSPPGQFP